MNNIAKIKSDQPTVLIAPSDYEHIYKGATDLPPLPLPTRPPSPPKKVVTRVPSDQPTVLIAPSDYEHIFKGSARTAEEKLRQVRVPSDTPTALIAPSDFQHIYADPALKKEIEQRNAMKEEKKMPKPQSQSKQMKSKSRSCQDQSQHHRKHQQEVMPDFIVNLVQKFIERQKKTYTIKTNT